MRVAGKTVEVAFEAGQRTGILPCVFFEVCGAIESFNARSEGRVLLDRREGLLEMVDGLLGGSAGGGDNVAGFVVIGSEQTSFPTFDCFLTTEVSSPCALSRSKISTELRLAVGQITHQCQFRVERILIFSTNNLVNVPCC